MEVLLIVLSISFHLWSSHAVNSTDDWIRINRTEIWRDLDSCAQECVLTVNDKVWDVEQGRYCRSYGCVCSGSTRGPNFQNAESNVTTCAEAQCSREEAVESATQTLGDLCLVLSLNSTRQVADNGSIIRITAEGYPNITDCARFVLNGCLNEDGIRDEPDCNPSKRTPSWEEYRGVAEQQDCTTPECICRGPNFDVSFGVAYDAGIEFCAMRPSTRALPNPQVDDMMNVLAEYCTGHGYPQRNYTYTYTGQPPGSETPKKMTVESKTQLGLAAAALVVALVALWISYRMFKLAKEA
ncbi:hypothetical protein M501DRAFT_1031753 [Patellaria atrata CBS 101060]|uniref:Extracellular membrane protein CFEM domain-containing protein n=1 Tax=Patellaria atrata CBS 101060 TaxID=1346257 RepID=A0A9P4SA51_9PEZI|nr:hypothetical protein M501DRAFT_1031753 [Patellaria atrata CBS 101060]